MATNYKNIVITPNIGSATDDPTIRFSGGNTSVNTDITLKVYPASNGTLSFEGSAGQLFSITNDLSGTIFSVNDVSGIPSIDVNADGTIDLAPYGGNVAIGRTNSTVGQNVKLDVAGAVNASAVLVNGTPISGGGANTSNVVPNSAQDGDLWWNPNLGKMFVYYADANSSQWVEASPGGIKSDAILTGQLAFVHANNAYAQANAAPTVYSTNIGNGSATSFTITHNLNKTNIFVAIREISSGYFVYPDVKYTSVNQVVIEFISAPTTNQYYVSILGA